MVAPLVEALLIRALRRRAGDEPATAPNRLVGEPHRLDSVGFVARSTSVLLQRPGAAVQVLPAGSLVLPALLGRTPASYAVVSHAPVDVWLRLGPFETLEGRVVQQIELQLTVALGDSPSGLTELLDPGRAGASDLAGVGDALLQRLAREVSAKITEAVRRRTLGDLTGLSLGVLLDGALPSGFLGGLLSRSALEVVDVDWPTEGRGWSTTLAPRPGGAGAPGPVPR